MMDGVTMPNQLSIRRSPRSFQLARSFALLCFAQNALASIAPVTLVCHLRLVSSANEAQSV